MFGNKKKNILENGIQARAVITQVRDTGVTINENPRVELTLQVQPDGAPPFEAKKKLTVSRVRIPSAGSAMWVRYDPADPSRVEFDEAKTQEVNAAAAAAPAGAAVSFGGAHVIDARNVPGLRDELLKAVADAQATGDQSEIQNVVMSALGGAQAAGASPAEADPLERLKKLNDLRKAGALTDSEFAAQKAKILGAG